jgi:hypothetical protein
MSGVGAIVVMSHEAPTVWIMLPNDEASDAHQNSAKTLCWNGASVALRQRSSDEAAGAVAGSVTGYLARTRRRVYL